MDFEKFTAAVRKLPASDPYKKGATEAALVMGTLAVTTLIPLETEEGPEAYDRFMRGFLDAVEALVKE